MTDVVLDTHAAIWYLENLSNISLTAAAAIDDALNNNRIVYVPGIVLVELVYLIERNRVSGIALQRLFVLLDDPDSGFILAPLDVGVAQSMKSIPRDTVPDMPDRIIAATALHLNVPLITRDAKIQALSNVKIIW